jgi:hypothetical protein
VTPPSPAELHWRFVLPQAYGRRLSSERKQASIKQTLFDDLDLVFDPAVSISETSIKRVKFGVFKRWL